jgi:hypothetical protein
MTIRPLHQENPLNRIKSVPLKALSPPVPPLLPMNDLDRVPGQRASPAEHQDKVTETAQRWVAQTFYGTLMRQMRNSPFKSELFEGGRGGQAFAPLLDQRLIDSMSKGTANRLTGAIARKLMGMRGTAAKQDVRSHVAAGLRA